MGSMSSNRSNADTEKRTPIGRRNVLAEEFDAVLFDNDSTLTDSKAAVERCWTLWARHYDVEPHRLRGTHGVPSAQIIARIAPELPQQEAKDTFDRLELENLQDVSALPGAVEALEAVGDRAAIITSAGRTLLRERLRAAGIPPSAVVVTADDVERGKPAPDPYLEGARLLGVRPERCLVVEDAPPGILSGRSAGAATLALLTTTPAAELDQADLIINDLSDITFVRADDGVRLQLR